MTQLRHTSAHLRLQQHPESEIWGHFSPQQRLGGKTLKMASQVIGATLFGYSP